MNSRLSPRVTKPSQPALKSLVKETKNHSEVDAESWQNHYQETNRSNKQVSEWSDERLMDGCNA